MRRDYNFYLYIMSSKSRALYTGVTNNLSARVHQHKSGEMDGFTKKYRVHRLVYFEQYRYIGNAIAREKEIKAWRREKRVALIASTNPTWEDLAEQRISENTKQIPRPLRGLRDDNSGDAGFLPRYK